MNEDLDAGWPVVADAVTALNTPSRIPQIPIDPSTAIDEESGVLDSLDLLDLMVAIEVRLGREIGGDVSFPGALDSSRWSTLGDVAQGAGSMLRRAA